MGKKFFKQSRYLTFLLRHNIVDTDLVMDDAGYVNIKDIKDMLKW
jgi:RNA:NAD 2'-phosphotransferase (TPT1/KptA family)